jgi:hypothetical protein
VLKSLRVCLQAWIASWHSSVHQGTGMPHALADDLGMELEAAQCRVLVKCSTMESTDGNFWFSKLTDCEKASQSALLITQLGWQDSSGIFWKCAGLWGGGHFHASLQGWTTQDELLSWGYRRRDPGPTSFLTSSTGMQQFPHLEKLD